MNYECELDWRRHFRSIVYRHCLSVQDGRNAEITAIRSGYGDVVEIVTRVNTVSIYIHKWVFATSDVCNCRQNQTLTHSVD